MDDDLPRSLFLKAKDQYDFAVRVGYVLVVAIFLFHLLTLSPYLEQRAEIERNRLELGTLAKSRDHMKEASSDLEQLADNTQQAIRMLGDTLFHDLVSDFRQLDVSLQEGLQASGSPEDLLRARSGPGPTQTATEPSTSFLLDQAVLEEIRAAKNDDERRRVLRPVVQRTILAPRFADMNRSWRRAPARTVVEVAGRVQEKLEQLDWPEAKERLTELKASVRHLGDAATQVEFKPPTDIKWWESRRGKMASISNIEEETIKELAVDQVAAQSRMLLDAMEVAVQQQKSLLEEVQQKLRATEEQFKEQQQKLAALARPLQFLSLDLEIVALRFPLLLGLLFGAGAGWLAGRTRDLWQTSKQLPEQNATIRSGSPLIAGVPPLAVAAVLLLVPLAWIWIAAWQLWHWKITSGAHSVVHGILGSILDLSGMLYLLATREPSHPARG